MTYTQYPPMVKRVAVEAALKADERIVCTNATVVMDGRGELSYFDNDAAIVIIQEGQHE